MWPFKKQLPIPVRKIEIAQLQPNDTLVLQLDDDVRTPPEMTQKIVEGLSNSVGGKIGVICLPLGSSVSVLRGNKTIPCGAKPPPTPVPSDGDPKTP